MTVAEMSGSDWLCKTLKRFRIRIEGNIFTLKWAICDTYGVGWRLQGLCSVHVFACSLGRYARLARQTA
ncbi:hypothetical protein [Nitrosospira sp. Nsp1]|uniref:hypothetical protein n=1 Tax=Nitrosospira sp. Nsp1 TaxID=136547 RepID=UPI000886BF65|nr:hypothetical protein [Nitrosospira sp. Nsp1]SCX52798.1 hypothetical protein SAMN05720354_11230 [Nitrosospira sp. Nsp1]